MSATHGGRVKTYFRLPLTVAVVGAVLGALWWGAALADTITPSQEQEFIDAKVALETARKAQAEKYAPEQIAQVEALLQTADSARQAKDAVSFSHASRLARAYADLAKAKAELDAEDEKLAATREELKKAKADIDRLQK